METGFKVTEQLDLEWGIGGRDWLDHSPKHWSRGIGDFVRAVHLPLVGDGADEDWFPPSSPVSLHLILTIRSLLEWTTLDLSFLDNAFFEIILL